MQHQMTRVLQFCAGFDIISPRKNSKTKKIRARLSYDISGITQKQKLVHIDHKHSLQELL